MTAQTTSRVTAARLTAADGAVKGAQLRAKRIVLDAAADRRRAFMLAREQGWSLGKIARATGMSKTRVAQILRGE